MESITIQREELEILEMEADTINEPINQNVLIEILINILI